MDYFLSIPSTTRPGDITPVYLGSFPARKRYGISSIAWTDALDGIFFYLTRFLESEDSYGNPLSTGRLDVQDDIIGDIGDIRYQSKLTTLNEFSPGLFGLDVDFDLSAPGILSSIASGNATDYIKENLLFSSDQG